MSHFFEFLIGYNSQRKQSVVFQAVDAFQQDYRKVRGYTNFPTIYGEYLNKDESSSCPGSSLALELLMD